MSAGARPRLLRLAGAVVRRVPPLRRLATSLHGAFLAQRELDAEIGELTPLAARPSARTAPRLNLLLPGASEQHVFGGASTALALIDRLAGVPLPDGTRLQRRILVTDERSLEGLDPRRFQGWRVQAAADDDRDDPVLVPLGDRVGPDGTPASVPVRAQDWFVATAWWTAHLARALVRWQADAGGHAPHPFVYLIQDFEPGFYPWSSRYALAEQTYRFDEPVIAVFNAGSLRTFFEGRGLSFAAQYGFEPTLHPELRRRLPDPNDPAARVRRILVYGRPGVPRNAFALLVRGLRHWAATDPRAGAWEVVSLGEAHPDVPLGGPGPVILRSEGKVSLDRYATLMRASAIGVSLMLSPHPSYPPLEMAAFGMRTLTNRFEGKSLAAVHPNLIELDALSPEALARQLSDLTARFDADADACWSLAPGRFGEPSDPFLFAEHLVGAWLGGRAGGPPASSSGRGDPSGDPPAPASPSSSTALPPSPSPGGGC
ncbi:MAG TPA: hypothetical protein PKJ79_12125 [Quisquiliibacterium sp.]|nr:hypothetical protein [Quisquiliibacterium sp.]